MPDAQVVKAGHAANFDSLNDQLAATPFDRHVRFFNYGYVPLEGEPVLGPPMPKRMPNQESAQLLFQVLGDTDLTDARVLEVGCGRGGNLWLISKYLSPRYVVGVDIAQKSMRFCRSTQDPTVASFAQGDAEVLPVASASMDAVVNVETSCTYPDIESFYREVARVLRPGGSFLYTDLIETSLLGSVRSALGRLGLQIVSEKNISANVLASREQRASRQMLAFGDTADDEGWDEYVGLDGSTLNGYLATGTKTYQIFRMRRDDSTPPTERLFTAAEQSVLGAGAQEGVDLLTVRPST